MFEDIVTLLMTHETKLEQHLHNSVEINSLNVNITTSNPNIITRFFIEKKISKYNASWKSPPYTVFSPCKKKTIKPSTTTWKRMHEVMESQNHNARYVTKQVTLLFSAFTGLIKNFKS